jgi:2-amino-4-hydroxy-6-hydroxymethyldihydropteridine diphosphokinase
MERIFLSLGSNIGDRAANIARAIANLGKRGVRVVKQSQLYETEPVELREQDWFLNGVVEVATEQSPQELMKTLLAIERSMGRERLIPKGPRIIDMDVLLFGDRVVNEAELDIPHPRMTERRFVLVPLAEIAPEAIHPALNKSAAELLATTADRSIVRSV